MSNAIETQGFKLEIQDSVGSPTWVEVGEITNYTAFDGSAAEIETTHLQSTAKEFLMGLQDWGSLQVDTNFLPDDPGQELMRDAKASRVLQNFRFTRSDDSQAVFSGYVTTAGESGGVDAKTDGGFNIRISGDVTFS